jgi:hypothetical protein
VRTVREDLVSALLAVDGIVAAAVEPLDGGPGTLRLELAPGSDEVAVAGAVNRLLRTRFGLAVDAERVQVLDGTAAPVIDVRRPPVADTEPVPARRPGASEDVAERAGRLSLQRVQLGAELTAVVLVEMRTSRGTQLLTGASVVGEDVRQGVVRAVLSAVNRRLALLPELPQLTELPELLTLPERREPPARAAVAEES